MNIKKPSIEHVKEKHALSLMRIPGVEGVGISGFPGRKYIVVYLSNADKSVKSKIPSQLEGYPVRCEVMGKVKAF